MNYDELLVTADLLVKAGKIREVAEKIRKLTLVHVPRKYRQPLAKICRRAGLIEQGLRLLQPIIRNERSLEMPPTPSETCEYSVLLSRNGSIKEALGLLSTVDESSAAESLLYQGFCRISQWDYVQAADRFENFLKTEADSYSKLIARVNLAAVYVANLQLNEAEILLQEIIILAQEVKATRLIGNAFELLGQVEFFRHDFAKARSYLKQALQIFDSSSSYDQLLILKWQTTMTALEEKSILPLMQFREEAIARKHWESVRDTDFYRLKIQFDQNIFDRLIYGTPSHFYRQRVFREISQKPSSQFTLGTGDVPELDLQTGRILSVEKGSEIAGKKIHQMLSVLLQDFYAPRNMGSLFAELYPDEYFDIDSSPLRVRQILRRTRRWLESNNLSATIEEAGGSYKLSLNGSFKVRMDLKRPTIDGFTTQWHLMERAFPSRSTFTAEQACKVLGISRTGFHRLLTWATAEQLITKQGNNRATTYRIASPGRGSSSESRVSADPSSSVDSGSSKNPRASALKRAG